MPETAHSLRGLDTSVAALLKKPEQWRRSTLGAFCFSTDLADTRNQAGLGVPCMHVVMPRLDAGDAVCEVWQGSGKLAQGQHGNIRYSHDDEILFGVMTLPETLFAASPGKTPLQQAAEAAYRQAFALLDALGYPHPFRFWNYIADINGQSFGLERYRQFNLGRQDAFLAHARDVTGKVPAACALGSTHGPLTIAFVAGRVAPLSIENPRQTSAYDYPQQYGPRSPTFSRACLVRLEKEEILFISGTASVVGHATLHPGNVVAQARETMINIKAVLAEANRLSSRHGFNLADLHYRVYVRHPADLAQVRAELSHCVGGTPKAIYLQADVCRQDLLLEIEATAATPLSPVSAQRN
jgi:chorismate lyase / 3-hydroxybenzoate synthase